MDWEKQDNELRRLLDGDAFLPESEPWNSHESWRKFRMKMQPERRKVLPAWLKLSVAACLAGILGAGIWYLQNTGSFSGPNEALVNSENGLETAPGNMDNLKPKAAPEIPFSNAPSAVDVVQKIPETKQPVYHKRIEKPATQPGAIINNTNQDESNDPKEEVVTVAIIEKQPETGTVTGVAPETGLVPADALAVVQAPVKKNKPKVVHYNQLGGMQSTPPPVFVQTRKTFPEWDGMVVQSLPTRIEQPFQLKIDISQAPKKSL